MHKLYRQALLVLLSFALAFSLGCSKKPSDETITKEIQDKVAADPDTKDSAVTVAANEGKVTLTGKAKTPAAQKKVETIAKEEPGVTDVDNETTVEPEAAAVPPPPPPPVEKPKPIVIPAGTALTVKLGQALGSKTSQAGQTFMATLAQPIGGGALPEGATCSGKVLSAKPKGKIKGQGELSVTLTSISVKGHTYPIQTNSLDSDVKGKGKRTAGLTVGGAAGGALIGGLAGGGKGAGIGAAVGAAAGLIGGAATGNKQIEIPAESALTFELLEPLTLPPAAK